MDPFVFVGQAPSGGSEQPQAPHNPKLRKRTKTGCLTCRKRRIKCGEERPTCNNCHKSKRHCEGYSQRVVFKPAGQWTRGPDDGQTTLQFHTGTLPGQSRPGIQALQPFMAPGQGGFAPPGYAYGQHGQIIPIMPTTPMTPMTPLSAGPFASLAMNGAPFYAQLPPHQPQGTWPAVSYTQGQASYFGQPWPHTANSSDPLPQSIDDVSTDQSPTSFRKTSDVSPSQFAAQYETAQPFPPNPQEGHAADGWPLQPKPELNANVLDMSRLRWEPGRLVDGHNGFSSVPEHSELQPGVSASVFDGSALTSPHKPKRQRQTSYHSDSGLDGQVFVNNVHSMTAQPAGHGFAPESGVLSISTTSDVIVDNSYDLLQGAAIATQDDDYHDYDPEIDDAAVMLHPQEDLSLMRSIHQQVTSASGMRRYDAFIYPGVLDSYRAEYHASPLRNERTVRVFAHFICATAPSLGIFERTPRNTEAIFGMSRSLQTQQQSLWTVAMPMRALHDFGLLQAILALASLHIANLQGVDTTPSVRHYVNAIRSVHKAVASEQKRHRVETLAATLLLGYYEVMTADHAKWCSHLLGAKQLLNEIGYPSMTRQTRRMRAEARAQRQMDDYGYPQPPFPPDSRTSNSSADNLDEGLVSTLIGRKLRYDEFGHVFGANETLDGENKDAANHESEQVDPDTYDLYQDLWWWFIRQDAYQSMVSGNRVLLNYARWSDCPPRARMGRSDATYGSHDHIMLMLGRIADFSSRDRRRKLRYIKSHSGQWVPPSQGFFPGLGNLPPPPMAPPPGTSRTQNTNPPYPITTGPVPAQAHVFPPYMSNNVAMGNGLLPSHPSTQMSQANPPPMNRHMQGNSHGPPPTPPIAQAPFMGMAPSADRQWMPASYESIDHAGDSGSPASSSDSSLPDEEALTTALQEWSSIQSALSVLRATFQPMLQPIDTAAAVVHPNGSPNEVFGPSIHYRQFDVAVLNALYHLCYIILCRAHPNMPPASMIAAGVAAPFTKDSAMQIGRTATGIFSQALSSLTASRGNTNGNVSNTIPALNPSIGGMLCEMTMPLFFAGVQYREQAQRGWLVDNLREIEVRCGWATAGMIGHGCETAWCRQAEAHRGPPYTRSGHWIKPDAEYGIKTPWSYGVRGGDRDAPPPAGASALSGQQGVTTEGLPLRPSNMPPSIAASRESQLARGQEIEALGASVIDGVEGGTIRDLARKRAPATTYAMGVMAEESH